MGLQLVVSIVDPPEEGEAVSVHTGAPAGDVVRRTALITTAIALVLWVLLCAIILSGWITIRDIDFFGRMGPAFTGE